MDWAWRTAAELSLLLLVLMPFRSASSDHFSLDDAGLTCKLCSQAEWRGLGVQQSRGWVHYAIHRPEPHIMLFRWGLSKPCSWLHSRQTVLHTAAACC